MSEAVKNKVKVLVAALEKKFGKYKLPTFHPPPTSADAAAAQAVATKNCELIAGAVLGLHGPPHLGFEAARRLMSTFVDWNEVRVSNAGSLMRMLGRDPRAEERIRLMQRFLEAFFLRQRNLNLECLVPMKPGERRQFLADLEIFGRDELAAVVLTCFGMEMFPPAEDLHRVAQRYGLIRAKTTVLQMAKEFETKLEPDQILSLYAGLAAVAATTCTPESPKCPACVLKPRCPAARIFLKPSRK